MASCYLQILVWLLFWGLTGASASAHLAVTRNMPEMKCAAGVYLCVCCVCIYLQYNCVYVSALSE